MLRFFKTFVLVSGLLGANLATAEPTTENLTITAVRPYVTLSAASVVYITMNKASLCGTNVYRIDMAQNAGKELYSLALAALMAGSTVAVEIDNGGCGTPTWNTRVQSIYIYAK